MKKEVKEIEREELKGKVLKARTVINVCLTIFSIITFPIYVLDCIVARIYLAYTGANSTDIGVLYDFLGCCIKHRIRMCYVKKYGEKYTSYISYLLAHGYDYLPGD
jgi:hypothetical protein